MMKDNFRKGVVSDTVSHKNSWSVRDKEPWWPTLGGLLPIGPVDGLKSTIERTKYECKRMSFFSITLHTGVQ